MANDRPLPTRTLVQQAGEQGKSCDDHHRDRGVDERARPRPGATGPNRQPRSRARAAGPPDQPVARRTDGFTSLAVAVGAVGVLLGFPLADPIVGILITLAILAVLKGAAVEVFRRLGV